MSLTQQEALYFNPVLGISGQQVNASVQAAVAADEAALFGTLTLCTQSDLMLTQLPAPPTPVITQLGTAGSTAYGYVVADVGNVGRAPSAAGTTATGNATLTSVNLNVIAWNAQPGHTYHVYRASSSGTPSGLGRIGVYSVPLTAIPGAVVSVTDTGQTATTTFVPAANTTGSITVPG